MKRQKEHYIMLQCAADTQYGIPTRCLCGSRIINEVRGKEEYDTLPGKRFFTCKNYEDDGLHYRHPWVFGVQEKIERLTKRVKESEEVILLVAKLHKQIEHWRNRFKTSLSRFMSSRGSASTENRS
ncbi:hypothetical protein Bca52824_018526 [Brassica carinata]|uniref:Zinc finger GRF-type domain-containing protein n=1 Tax=Brassica carinata TaxID=52824 RepID=A0A8X7VPP2_BRACI|nr:hypothetical protein Bca52824_018526 [Brassica carinata]